MISLFEENLLLEADRILKKNIRDRSFFSILDHALKQILIKFRQTPALKFYYERDYEFLLGFEQFKQYKKLHFSLRKFKISQHPLITKFVLILIQFNDLLDSLELELREKLFNEFSNKWLKERLFPFQAEIETFTLLKKLEFRAIRKPDVMLQGYYDFEAMKEDVIINYEVKTLNRMSGHPIDREAAAKFGSYIDREFLKQNFEASCIIEYHFPGRLVQRVKNPQDNLSHQLIENFYKDIRLNAPTIKVRKLDIKNGSDLNILSQESKELQSGLLCFENLQNKTMHIIKLISDHENTYFQNLEAQILRALKKFINFGQKRPSVIFLQLASMPQAFYLNHTIQLKLKEFLKNYLSQDFPMAIIVFTDLKLGLNPIENKFENKAGTYGIHNNLFFPYVNLFKDIFEQELGKF